MDSGKRRSQRDYTLAFKLSVVDQVEKGELSYKEAQRRYGIQGRSTVLVWLRKHGRQDWSQGASIREPRSRSMTEPTLPLTPEQRIKELEEQLALSNQKAQFFEAVGHARQPLIFSAILLPILILGSTPYPNAS
jgi:transposase-like protein